MRLRQYSRSSASLWLPVAWCLLSGASVDAQGTTITGLQASGAQVASSASPPQGRADSPSPAGSSRLQGAPAPGPQQPQPRTPAPAPSSIERNHDGDALKIFQQGSRNIRQLQSQGLRGWMDGSDPCQGWTGVSCNDAGRVTKLELGGWGLETRLPPELAGLSQLEVLNLTGNDLLGGLPSNWGNAAIFPNLTVLDLSDNLNLSGALPPSWGSQGAFAHLEVLSLASTGVSGQLPLAWGGNLSLPSLTFLDLSNNFLDGILPPGWGTEGAFLELRTLKLANNSFSGGLPEQWGSSVEGMVFQSLSELDLSNNTLSGTLPDGWGTGFQVLSELSLANNSLSGELPAEWARGSRWGNLKRLDVPSNLLNGSIPDIWSAWSILPQLSLVLLPGNEFCGTPPTELASKIEFANGTSASPQPFEPCKPNTAPAPSPRLFIGGQPAPAPGPSHLAHVPAPLPVPAPSPQKIAPAPAPQVGHLQPAPQPAPRQQPVAAPQPVFMPAPAPAPALLLGSNSYLPAPAPQPTIKAPAPSPFVFESPATAPSPTAPLPSPARVPSAFIPAPMAPAPAMGVASAVPHLAPAPSPGFQELAQVLARYNLTGPNLASNNQTVQRMVLTALSNTLGGRDISGIQLQSFQSQPAAGRRRLLISADDAQAIFLINTTMGNAAAVVQNLNDSSTTNRFGQQLGVAGLPSVQPALQEARITNPLITNPLAPSPTSQAPPPAVLISPQPTAGSSGISGGAIGGIVAGVIVALLLLAGLVLYMRKRKRGALDTEKGMESEAGTPKKPQERSARRFLAFWPFRGKPSGSPSSSGSLDDRAARAALKNRKPSDSADSPAKAANQPPTQQKETGLILKQVASTQSSMADADSFEEEERHTIARIPASPPDSPARSEPIGREHRLDSAQSMKNAGSGRIQSSRTPLPGTDTPSSEPLHSEASPSSDHTAMVSEAAATDQGLSGQSEAFSGSTSASSSEGKRKVPVAGPSRAIFDGMQSIDEKQDLPNRELQSERRSGSGQLSGSKELPLGGSRSRSAALLRALERELRQGQAPPSSYSRRHTAGEAQIRQPKQSSGHGEKREVPLHWTEGGGQRRPTSDAIRRNLEALEALERKHGGGWEGGDTAKLRAEVEQILGQGGYLTRTGEERAPPPSYHRRLAEETNPGRASSSRQASGSLSRNASGMLPGRQGSSGLTPRTSGGIDQLLRLGSGQGEVRRQLPSNQRHVRSGSGALRLDPTSRGELRRLGSGQASGLASGDPRPADKRGLQRNVSNDRLARPAPAGNHRAEERQLRRQQSSQREVMLRDLERQLGLDPAPPPRQEARRDVAREQRMDQRREIAQRARKFLEDMGGIDPTDSTNRQVEQSGSRRPKQREEGGTDPRKQAHRP